MSRFRSTAVIAPLVWSGGGFSGAWSYTAAGDQLHCDDDLMAALGLPDRPRLRDFLAVVEPADLAMVESALAAAVRGGGRVDRRFKLCRGPAAGHWARLSGLASGGVLRGALTDLPGEGLHMETWRDAEQCLRHAFDQTPTTAVQGYDRQRRVIYWNDASEAVYGWRREEALGRQLEELIIPPPMRADVVRLHTAWVERDEPIPAAELELMRKDGSGVPVFSSHVMLRNGWGEPEMYCIDVDLRQQREAMQEGRLREHQLHLVSRVSHAGWWEWNLQTDRLRWSSELGHWFGGDEAGGEAGGDAPRATLLAGLPASTRQQLLPMWERVQAGEAVDAELRHGAGRHERHYLLHAEPADPKEPLRRVGTLLDITESKAAASRIDRLVRFDAVTGLPNRLLMRERLDEAIARCAAAPQDGGKVLVGCLGLDEFRLVNESFGMQLGDRLLNACAERLQARLRGRDLVVRLGGDQFGILLEGMHELGEAEVLADKLLGLFRQPFACGDQELFLSASLGLSVYPEDGDKAETLMQHAETALHRAKEQGRGHHQFFRADMNQRSLERVQLLNGLRRALAAGELALHFQPQYRLADRRLLGAEALLRWNSAQFGNVPPDRFIPLAEESGLIEPIGDWVLTQCCEQLRAWREAGHGELRLAANLSTRQLRSMSLVERLSRELQRCEVPAHLLELEVTESVLMERDERSRDILFALKGLGLSLAIDDFGTGYSSLAYLRRFPVDVLKIDRSFVHELGQDADANALVRAIGGMAQALKLNVVAEGVETAEQAAFLAALGCEAGQGWHFGRPVPAEVFVEKFLR